MNESKKDYLNEYKNLCYKLKSLEEQLQSLRVVNEAAKIQTISDMPKGNKQSDLSDYICKIERLEEKIRVKKMECDTRRIEIEDHISEMKNGLECDVLRKRYIEFKSWENICIEINYSWRQTHYIHSKALKNINIA